MKVLVTGFEPFGGESVNPSWETAQRLSGEYSKMLLPVEYDKAGDMLLAALARERPDIVVCLGQAGGRRGLSIELAALNRDHAHAPDNAGVTRQFAPIARGENAYFSSVDAPGIIKAIAEQGVEARISYFAGTYVCNHVYYLLLKYIADNRDIAGLFIHVPYSDTQNADGMPISEMVSGVGAAIKHMVSHAQHYDSQ